MFRDEKLEFKVGIFIGVGIFLMFLIVFSIGDLYPFQKGYSVNVIFDFVNGITEDAPVRLAGVDVGEVKAIAIYYDEEVKRTRVKLEVRVKGDVNIETDAVARINTLGLLGERYLEITPGIESRFLKAGDVLIGKNPLKVGQQMEALNKIAAHIEKVLSRLDRGEGTFGKLLTDDTLYEDWKVIFGRLKDGEGTIGKLLADETIYNDLEDFVKDIKAHPWKLLSKPRKSR
ncbi:MAG: MlaD family protein [Candidatus Omnitrophota bacterium]|jgi:phospholipid/cholesterol/gamma-HCH transport system substrate-binding protein